jgi:hypothetical protein
MQSRNGASIQVRRHRQEQKLLCTYRRLNDNTEIYYLNPDSNGLSRAGEGKASIKKIDGVAIASVKKIDGVTNT